MLKFSKKKNLKKKIKEQNFVKENWESFLYIMVCSTFYMKSSIWQDYSTLKCWTCHGTIAFAKFDKGGVYYRMSSSYLPQHNVDPLSIVISPSKLVICNSYKQMHHHMSSFSFCFYHLPINNRPGQNDNHVGTLIGQKIGQKMMDDWLLCSLFPCLRFFLGWRILQYLCWWCCTSEFFFLQYLCWWCCTSTFFAIPIHFQGLSPWPKMLTTWVPMFNPIASPS